MEVLGTKHRDGERVEISGVLALSMGDSSMIRYRVENLSRSGTLLSYGECLPVGEILELFIVTPDLEVIEVSGEVVRHDPPRSSIGVKFTPFSPDTRHALEDLMQQMS